MVGLVDDPVGRSSRTEIIREIETKRGDGTVEKETIKEKRTRVTDELKFSAQLARRYWDFASRRHHRVKGGRGR